MQHRTGTDVLPLAGGEVVERVHLVAARDQRVDDVGAYEPCAPSDYGPHFLLS